MAQSDEQSDWLAQARRGVIELCVLTILARQPTYGYDLVNELGRSPALATATGTLYPLLNRLRRLGAISAGWQESNSGPPRKYYSLTKSGDRLLARMTVDWDLLATAVTGLREESTEVKQANG